MSIENSEMTKEESKYVVASTAMVAPVTALEFMGEDYLLTAEGPVLSVYCLPTQPKLRGSLSVLHNYRIHGLRPRPSSDCGAPSQVWDEGAEIAVFGGKGLRLVTFTAGSGFLQLSGPLMELQDWLLDVQWLGGETCTSLLGVVLAHNTALLLQAKAGTVVSLRSCQEVCLLYSGLLIGSLWDSGVLVGGTVFNQLVLWRPGTSTPSAQAKAAPVERRLLGHSGVIFSLAYLPQAGLLASASDDRSVRVWSVGSLGESGSCLEELDMVCQHVLYGHQARVFCVRLAQTGVVFSAGEDGACVMWGKEDGRVERRFKGHRAGGVRALAVSEKQQWVATGGADGGVRVWKVRGQEEEKEEAESPAREDGEVGGVVDLEFTGEGSPKAVCLVDVCTGVEQEEMEAGVLVCTDQGRVYLRQGQEDWKCVWEGDCQFQSYCVMETVDVRGKGCVCAVGNLNGQVCVFSVADPGRGVVLSAGAGKVHSLQWVWPGWDSQGEDVFLLASGAEGRVYRWKVGMGMDEGGVTLTMRQLRPFLLPPCAKRWLTAAVMMTPERSIEDNRHPCGDIVWVCGDRRGSLLLYREQGASGERGSGVEGKKCVKNENTENFADGTQMMGNDGKEIEDIGEDGSDAGEDAAEPVCVLFGVHGKQGVTSVYEHDGVCYSTGRDGFVRILVVHGSVLTVQRAQRAAKGMEWLERVLFLQERLQNWDSLGEMGLAEEEGEGRTGSTSGRREGGVRTREEGRVVAESRFALVGFRSASFVVWDPLRQETLLSVPCGGGHRSWGYRPPNHHHRGQQHHISEQDAHGATTAHGANVGSGLLVFIKQGAVLAHHPPTHARSVAMATGQSLREGLHGRGVGCVCRLGMLGGRWEVLATGGEDTCVSVLAVHSHTGAVRVLTVITDHISNVRALTALRRDVARSPSTGLSCLLFSAGGRAQLQCYRLLIGWDGEGGLPTCQVSQIASHRLDEQWERKRNRHKTVKMDPETRYMSLCVVQDGPTRVLLALACSDGAVRLFAVSERAGKVELLWECHYHQRCVLSIASHRLRSSASGQWCVLVLSAATDGRVCVWDWTSVLSLSEEEQQSWEGPTAPCFTVPIHQSGVNSLAVWEEPEEGSPDEHLLSLATGGDDGQLSVLLLKATFPHCQPEGPASGVSLEMVSHWSKPLAHSAPLTALQVIGGNLIVSTSPDQRVCVWSVCRDGSTGLRSLATAFTHTADVAGLQVWRAQEGGAGAGPWAAVCGQGLELLSFTRGAHDEEKGSRKLQERLKVNFTRNGENDP